MQKERWLGKLIMAVDCINIVLVDDHKVVRESWKILLERNPRLKIVGEASNGQDAIELVEKLLPDILLVDINMSPANGFAVTQRIVESAPSVKIIGISVNNQSNYATQMLKLGAKGFLTKTSSLEEINRGIVEVYNGGKYICEEIRKNMPPSD